MINDEYIFELGLGLPDINILEFIWTNLWLLVLIKVR
jgi:hypothetical protein